MKKKKTRGEKIRVECQESKSVVPNEETEVKQGTELSGTDGWLLNI